MLLALLFTACDEDVVLVGPADLNYSAATFDIDFWTSGQTGTPLINWNGSTGTFGLAESYEGVSINTSSGVVSWSKGLPIGTNTIVIIATNANGTLSKTITLNNPFQGVFIGTYNFDPDNEPGPGNNYTLEFQTDGSLTATDFTTSSVSGSYTIDEETLEITGTYDYGYGAIYIDGTLSYSNAMTPEIVGNWGNAENDLSGGTYKVFLD